MRIIFEFFILLSIFYYDSNTPKDTVDIRFVVLMIMYICGKQTLGLANGQEYPIGTIYSHLKIVK